MPTPFASDNCAPVQAVFLDAITELNATSNGRPKKQEATQRAIKTLRDTFENEKIAVIFSHSGVMNNILQTAALASYSVIVTTPRAHIINEEYGACAHAAGLQIIELSDTLNKNECSLTLKEDKLTPELLNKYFESQKSAIQRPTQISIAQPTEVGTLYSIPELKEICRIAHANGAKVTLSLDFQVYMDGARYHLAVAGLGCTPAEGSWKAGVDMLGFGMSKNGILMVEAFLIFSGDDQMKTAVELKARQLGSGVPKLDYLTAQIPIYLENEFWLKSARHMINMAKELSTLLNVKPMFPVETNTVYLKLPNEILDELYSKGYLFYRWTDGAVRFIMAHDTTHESVKQLATDINYTMERYQDEKKELYQ